MHAAWVTSRMRKLELENYNLIAVTETWWDELSCLTEAWQHRPICLSEETGWEGGPEGLHPMLRRGWIVKSCC